MWIISASSTRGPLALRLPPGAQHRRRDEEPVAAAGRGRAAAVRNSTRNHRRQGVPHHQHPVQALSGRPGHWDSGRARFVRHARGQQLIQRYIHSRRHLYIDELEQIQDGVHVTATIIDMGNANFELPIGAFQINKNGKQALRLARRIPWR
ncbi:uncharacterized protein BO95DRAFT_428990 [Aspergillus brunneoviolaceus CBS 621.78]|uniref:Uncharacterized protein n=1 Tax=Aspergillus brunneoviolaceus CBS 621.78 TaxID=1450534 RepID=A0ACD1GHM3_9EURO|nr:hypothetical protein BO95DRAFT_428990 [Aspergillus brunneoviolaceus CBS 621.78]RAH48761.1 hypothetical protein BO95DRAFT_428990 [Aspergillus brunneoviolaceus CBS 621.78]